LGRSSTEKLEFFGDGACSDLSSQRLFPEFNRQKGEFLASGAAVPSGLFSELKKQGLLIINCVTR
jgi:hypothetical protein